MAKRGRPPLYKTAKEIEQAVDAYLSDCQTNGKPVTLTGAMLALGMHSRQSLHDYEQSETFSGPIKRLRLAVEAEYEARLHGQSPTGAIFALKNFGWRDNQQLEHSGPDGGPVKTETTVDPSKLDDVTLENLMAAKRGGGES